MITLKQINFIVWILERDMPLVFSMIPKNNAKYTKFADYRRQILADIIQNYHKGDARTLIDLIKHNDVDGVKLFIFGLNNMTDEIKKHSK